MSYTFIELDDFGFAASQQLENFRIILGKASNASTATLSLVGAFNTTQPVVVPLPLPILLMASGLGVLGLLARRAG